MHALTFLTALALGTTALPSAAATFNFYRLGNGSIADFRPTDGVACTGGDLCSSNVDAGTRNGDLHFVSDGLTATATARYLDAVAAVVQDHQTPWTATRGAGLGVYHLSGAPDDDNITLGEKLTIVFDEVVHLSSLELRSEGHSVHGWPSAASFLFNGVSTPLPRNVGSVAFDLVGQSFDFAFGGSRPDQFYLAGMTVEALPGLAAPAAVVPEPASLALAGLGLGALGLARRRARGRSH